MEKNHLHKERVLVGMSGGIDSSAVCLLLQEQGYEVVGVTMRVWDLKRQFHAPDQEYPDFILEAKSLADRLGIEHHVADERVAFKDVVVQNFVDEYMCGRTPNPCVLCNPLFKFRMLQEWADRLNCAYVATGHYVRLINDNGRYVIQQGVDERKDQSYFLWRLGQGILSRCMFPLGGYRKDEVRDYLHRKGFELKSRQGESMEVCFIEGDYRDFLRQQVPDLDKKIGEGSFVDAQGHRLGTHQGFAYYTIGQRKGLGIALGKPAFVLKINPQKNTVMLGDVEQLLTRFMLVEHFVLSDEAALSDERLTVRIRYRSKPLPCRVLRVSRLWSDESGSTSDELLLVRFEAPASAVTPGQSAVFYLADRVVGGGYIASQKGLYAYEELWNKENQG